jgi:hypothetical protein
VTTRPTGRMTPPVPTDPHELLGACDEAVTRAAHWLVQQLQTDGALGDPADGFTYHRAPWALTLAGRHDEAHAVLGWVRRTLLTPDGSLAGEARRSTDGWAYRDSSLIIGAHMLQQYDLSTGLMPSLLRWQDPVSGGFANDLTDQGPSDEMDIPYACGPGLACLVTGHLDAAHHVAEFLRSVYDAQDELPERFFAFWSRDYQAFSMAAADAQFHYPSACKSSWGAAVLYEITGDATYLEWLGRFARWYLAAQEPEGYWHPWVERTRGQVIEITLEFVVHLVTLTGAVRGRLGPSRPLT